MEDLCVQLNDLPDEILLIIFKKLTNINLLYSLLGVNKQLNKIVYDSMFTSSLTLFTHSLYEDIYPLANPMLDRFFLEILPEIDYKIKWLNVEVSSMKRILLSGNYPNLFGLGIYNIEKVNDTHLFQDESSLRYRLRNQISSIVIKSINEQELSRSVTTQIFTDILHFFSNLQYLTFDSSIDSNQRISFGYLPPTVFSSILLELHVKVDSIDDCLRLLDGRFNQLQMFYVDIRYLSVRSRFKLNKEKLPSLRDFRLYCFSEVYIYDETILPLLQRMLNLEELHLYVLVNRENEFIDGNDIKQNIIDYMPRLNRFHLNICSTILINDQIRLPSNDDIQHTLKYISNDQIICCVDYFLEAKKGQCHIYSYPFTIPIYENITNNFPGGLFKCVREVSLFDEYPFQHEFFIKIAKSFPFLKNLTITNRKAQNDKQSRRSKNNNDNFVIIEFPHLRFLEFKKTHDDYLEQFLLHTRTCLPYNVSLFTDYKSLKRVTRNFTRNATRVNCGKMTYVYFNKTLHFPKHLENYLNVKRSI